MIKIALALILLGQTPAVALKPDAAIRFATFNASLNRDKPGGLLEDLSTPDNVQAANVAEIIQRVRPDVLLINEFDYDKDGLAGKLFQTNYLGVAHNGTEPIIYPYRFTSEVNTGIASGVDLDNDGKVVTTPGSRGYGNDALGFGAFPGQYGMMIYSKFPIDGRRVFTKLTEALWRELIHVGTMPQKADGSPWYSPQALEVVRLSSKGHWDVPIKSRGRMISLLVSHPTPPAFDGPERRNVLRNEDEIRLWSRYLDGFKPLVYTFSGPGREPIGLRSSSKILREVTPPETFVIMGDLNADPVDGGGVHGAIDQLMKHPRVAVYDAPPSAGAVEASKKQGQANSTHKGNPALDTADFADNGPGNLRVDYVLPSQNLEVLGSGVFWPVEADPLSRLVKMSPVASSDHRLVYVDIKQP